MRFNFTTLTGVCRWFAALTRLKEAFVKVLDIYRIRLNTHFNSKNKDIKKIYDVKQREEGEKLLGLVKYHVYGE